MINMQHRIVSFLMALVVATSLSACSGLNKVGSFLSDKKTANYQNNRSVKDLEFPPDLTAPEFDKEFELPSSTSTVSMRSGGIVSTDNNFAQPATSAVNYSGNTRKRERTGVLSSIKSQAGETVLHIHDTYPRALILTEIMLERIHFSILSRDAGGNYRVQYKGADITKEKKKGFLSGTLDYFKSLTAGSAGKVLANNSIYQVRVVNQGGLPLLYFKGGTGQTLPNKSQVQIITLFNNEFNR